MEPMPPNGGPRPIGSIGRASRVQGRRSREGERGLGRDREGTGKGRGRGEACEGELMEAKPDGWSHLRMAGWLDEPARQHLHAARRSAGGSSACLSMRRRDGREADGIFAQPRLLARGFNR